MESNKKIIAFDINGTLTGTDNPEDAIAAQQILKRLKRAGHKIIVWTGNTKEDAQRIVKELKLEDYVDECRSKGQ